MDQDLKDIYMKRDEAKLEYERLNEGIRQSRIAHDDYMRQEKTKQSELQELLKNVNDKSIEYQEAKMVSSEILNLCRYFYQRIRLSLVYQQHDVIFKQWIVLFRKM